MPVQISPSSEYGKELRKWEQHHTKFSLDEDGDSKPGNPFRFRMYPLMLYKAQQRNGQWRCLDEAPSVFGFTADPTGQMYQAALIEWETFNRSCTILAHDEDDQRRLQADGWCMSPREAVAHREAIEQDIARAAAEANFGASTMGAPAQREWEAAQAATSAHVVDVQPTKGGKKKTVAPGDPGAE